VTNSDVVEEAMLAPLRCCTPIKPSLTFTRAQLRLRRRTSAMTCCGPMCCEGIRVEYSQRPKARLHGIRSLWPLATAATEREELALFHCRDGREWSHHPSSATLCADVDL